MGRLNHAVSTTVTNVGSPTGRESYGHGVAIVVVGATPHQGTRYRRVQGEVRQGTAMERNREVRRMRTAETILTISYWRAS